MPMQDEQRRAYLERAGVSQRQIDETVGDLPINEDSFVSHGLTRAQAEQAQAAIRQVLADATIISAKYSTIAQTTGQEVAATVDAKEMAADRAHLNELFAEEYALTNPYGEVQDRAHVVDAMVKGMIHWDGLGQAGFEATGQTLHVHPGTATAIGEYRMKASSQAKNTQTGEAFRQDVSGTYRITNTYVFRHDRWQAATSQMTSIPEERSFVLTPES